MFFFVVVCFVFKKSLLKNVTTILSSRAVQNQTPGRFWKVASPCEPLKAGFYAAWGCLPASWPAFGEVEGLGWVLFSF